jgi:hypothetical protein
VNYGESDSSRGDGIFVFGLCVFPSEVNEHPFGNRNECEELEQLDYKQNSHKYDGVENVKRQKGDLHKTEFALGLLLDGVFVGGCEIVVHRINLRYYIVNLIILYIWKKINRKADKK